MPPMRTHGRVRRGLRPMCYQSGSEEMGVEVPTRSASSSEGEMERGVTPPPPSPRCVVSSQPRGVASLLTGPSISERRSKHLRAEGGPRSDLSR
jgi:hypothetical protein